MAGPSFTVNLRPGEWTSGPKAEGFSWHSSPGTNPDGFYRAQESKNDASYYMRKAMQHPCVKKYYRAVSPYTEVLIGKEQNTPQNVVGGSAAIGLLGALFFGWGTKKLLFPGKKGGKGAGNSDSNNGVHTDNVPRLNIAIDNSHLAGEEPTKIKDTPRRWVLGVPEEDIQRGPALPDYMIPTRREPSPQPPPVREEPRTPTPPPPVAAQLPQHFGGQVPAQSQFANRADLPSPVPEALPVVAAVSPDSVHSPGEVHSPLPDALAEPGVAFHISMDERGFGPDDVGELPSEVLQSYASGVPVADKVIPNKFGINIPGVELLEKIGEGGMGEIYRGIDKRGREVAVKVIRPSSESAEFTKRFVLEAKAIGRMMHTNVAMLLDFGRTDDGRYFMVQRFYRGGNLTAWKRQQREQFGRNIPVKLVLKVIIDLLRALVETHKNGILHRDIKPDNIFIDEVGNAVLGDFGLVRHEVRDDDQTALTRADHVMGTLGYMSPEQLMGEDVDIRTDIYAATVTLYYLLTGKKPYPISSPEKAYGEIFKAMRKKDPIRNPSQYRTDVSSNLDFIIQKGLAVDPDRRFATPKEMLRELEAEYNRLS